MGLLKVLQIVESERELLQIERIVMNTAIITLR